MRIIACPICGSEIHTNRSDRKYCSTTCSGKAYREAHPELYGGAHDCDRSQTGAASELLVCVDLLRQGYDVFRAQSPSSSCDLVVILEGKALRIEVKTGRYQLNGDVSFAKSRLDPNKYDALAIVLPTNEIVYQPTLDLAVR